MPKKISARKGTVSPPRKHDETEKRRKPHGKELFPRSEAHRRAIGESNRDTWRRKRVAAALPDIRRACWNDLTCDLCGATVPDGADQQTRDAAHRPECLASQEETL